MKKFITAFRDFNLSKTVMRHIDPAPRLKFCFNPAQGAWFTSLYFSDNYINQVQKCEVVL